MTNQPTARKFFTAELRRFESVGVVNGGKDISNREIFDAIQALKSDLSAMENQIGQPSNGSTALAAPQAGATSAPSESREDIIAEHEELKERRAEMDMMKTELRALANSIHQTKKEIAALRPPDSDDDRIIIVTNELDAVVQATENATDKIMDSVEAMENVANQIKAQVQDSHLKELVDEINDHGTQVFEACNFQDITGQRITKVVNTLKYIEDRVEAMMGIWGKDTFEHLPEPDAKTNQDDDAKLLNGPQLTGKGISQDDIDNLFD